MTTLRQQYRILNPTDLTDAVNQLNNLLAQITDRLDQIEGYRGTPAFESAIDMKGNDITNVGTITYA